LEKQQRRRREQLGFLFERYLPGSIEDVQAVYEPVRGSDQVLACALPRTDLDELLRNSSPVTLSPDALARPVQDALDGAASSCSQLNLLVGTYEPAVVRRLRRHLGLVLISIIVLVGLSAILGLERRRVVLDARVGVVHEARAALLRPLLELRGGQPLDLALTEELRRLQQTRGAARTKLAVHEVTDDLQAVADAWPRSLPVRVESASVTQDAIVIRALLPSPADVQRLADALAEVPGWALEPPQVNVNESEVRATLQLQPVEGRGAQP
jgi:hypothetical protein